MPDDRSKLRSRRRPAPRAQPEELAPAYAFLASGPDSSYIAGTVLQVMGGETTGG